MPFVGPRPRALDPMKAIEYVRQFRGRDAGAGVPDDQLELVVDEPHRDGDLALERELQGVRQEIEDDLFPHLAIDVGRLVERRQIEPQRQAGALDRRAEHAGELAGEGAQVGRLVRRFDAAGLDAREVEQRIDQLGQPKRVAAHQRPALALLGRQSVAASSASSAGPSISVSGVRNS